MRIVYIILIILLTSQQAIAYQNPYQNMWWDAIWRKDCIFDTQQQMCISSSENYKTLADYNKDRQYGQYVCIGGKLHKRMGFNQQPILLTHTTGLPQACTGTDLYELSK